MFVTCMAVQRQKKYFKRQKNTQDKQGKNYLMQNPSKDGNSTCLLFKFVRLLTCRVKIFKNNKR